MEECKTNKFFGNKLWQATKFTNKWMETISLNQNVKQIEIETLGEMDKWILSKLSYMVDVLNESLHKFELHVATSALKNFLYYEFCDVYLVSDFLLFFFISIYVIALYRVNKFRFFYIYRSVL